MDEFYHTEDASKSWLAFNKAQLKTEYAVKKLMEVEEQRATRLDTESIVQLAGANVSPLQPKRPTQCTETQGCSSQIPT